jgi:acetylornithine aminotransferase
MSAATLEMLATCRAAGYRPAVCVLAHVPPGGACIRARRRCRMYDARAAAYLDFASGIGVNALGYADPEMGALIQAQLDRADPHVESVPHGPVEALARELTAHARSRTACSSATPARRRTKRHSSSRAVAAARSAAPRSTRSSRCAAPFTAACSGRWRPRTAASMQEPFEPLMPGVRFVEPGDIDGGTVSDQRERTAAIIVEPVQGEGGVRPLDAGYLRDLRRLADEADALLIFDEVQCGLGRTARLFAYERWACAGHAHARQAARGRPAHGRDAAERSRCSNAIQPGDHATTFGGGPLVAAVALHVVQRLAAPASSNVVRRARLGTRWSTDWTTADLPPCRTCAASA